MPKTYEPIATFTANGSQSVITFSSIPQTYTDLVFVNDLKYSVGDSYVAYMRFNSDSGTNYSYTRITGNGSASASSRLSSINYAFGGWTGTNPAPNIVQVMNYSNTTTNKTSIVRANVASDRVAAYVNLWRNTAAITSISFTHESPDNYASGSTFTLYGIKAA
jgi:hypothetical protein